jgi:hypothetical protein
VEELEVFCGGQYNADLEMSHRVDLYSALSVDVKLTMTFQTSAVGVYGLDVFVFARSAEIDHCNY